MNMSRLIDHHPPSQFSARRWNIFPILHGAYFRAKFRETSVRPKPPACLPMILIARADVAVAFLPLKAHPSLQIVCLGVNCWIMLIIFPWNIWHIPHKCLHKHMFLWPKFFIYLHSSNIPVTQAWSTSIFVPKEDNCRNMGSRRFVFFWQKDEW